MEKNINLKNLISSNKVNELLDLQCNDGKFIFTNNKNISNGLRFTIDDKSDDVALSLLGNKIVIYKNKITFYNESDELATVIEKYDNDRVNIYVKINEDNYTEVICEKYSICIKAVEFNDNISNFTNKQTEEIKSLVIDVLKNLPKDDLKEIIFKALDSGEIYTNSNNNIKYL